MSDGPVVIDQATITGTDMAEAVEASGLATLAGMSAADQVRLNLGLAWVVMRRTNPALTYADVAAMPITAYRMGAAEGEVLGASNGAPLPASQEPGA